MIDIHLQPKTRVFLKTVLSAFLSAHSKSDIMLRGLKAVNSLAMKAKIFLYSLLDLEVMMIANR